VIQRADAIVYDRLINPDILRMAPPGTELMYVGKEEGYHSVPQEEINRMLARAAQKHRTVVRLKGGDPHVFGRGAEEEAHLHEQGIRFEVVPGISSALAAPAYAGIPVTHRNLAASFAVVTGHLASADETSSHNWASLAGIDTLVFVMGVKNKSKIAGHLIAHGKDPHEPAAFVCEGTTTNQKVVLTTLKELVESPPEVTSPAVLIIGKVVTLHKDLAWFNPAVHLEAAQSGATGAFLLASTGKSVKSGGTAEPTRRTRG
jgi:uroporphyrin-III C-methyltransferase